MRYLEYFYAYICFSLTLFFSTCIYVGGDAYKKEKLKLRLGLYPFAALSGCAVAAAIINVTADYMQDGIGYTIIGLIQFAFMLTAYRIPKEKTVFVFTAGLISRHAGSRFANCLTSYMPIDNVFATATISVILLACLLLPLWWFLGRNIQKDELYSAGVKQTAATFVIACLLMFSAYLEPPLKNVGAVYYVGFVLIELIFCYALLAFQYVTYRHAKTLFKVRYDNELQKLRIRQYENMQSVIDAMNIKYHDLKHQIRKLADGRTADGKVLRDIEQTLQEYGAFVKTGNDTLDAVLTEKSVLCARSGIELSCKIDGTALGFLSAEDISAFFGNALDNAFEHLSGIADPDKKYIHVDLTETEYFVRVCIENGLVGTVEFKSDGLPESSKGDKMYHGFGTASISKTAEKYGGTAVFTASGDTFKLTAVFAKR